MNFLYSKFLLICEKYSNEKLDMLMYSGLNVNYILIVIFKQVSYNRFFRRYYMNEDIVLSDGELIEEVYDNEGEDDSGYCVMKFNEKFYYCGFDFGGSLGCMEEFSSLEELKKNIVE